MLSRSRSPVEVNVIPDVHGFVPGKKVTFPPSPFGVGPNDEDSRSFATTAAGSETIRELLGGVSLLKVDAMSNCDAHTKRPISSS